MRTFPDSLMPVIARRKGFLDNGNRTSDRIVLPPAGINDQKPAPKKRKSA